MVSQLPTADRSNFRRLIGVALLAFFAFLPLHYHAVTASSQIVRECSCIHGTRTQLAFDADPPRVIPPLLVEIFAAQYVFSWADNRSSPQNVRAPPSALSV